MRIAAVTQGAEVVMGCPVFPDSIIILLKEAEKTMVTEQGEGEGSCLSTSNGAEPPGQMGLFRVGSARPGKRIKPAHH